LRGFFRFLALRGQCDEALVRAVPAVAHRPPRLPRSLTESQIHSLLASFDRATSLGCRNHCIALCMARLGMRVGEVVAVRLDDIDWHAGVIRISPGKGRRESTLPLPREVGRAVAAYIRHERPDTQARQIFVTHCAPRGLPLTSGAAAQAIRRALTRSAPDAPFKGTHALRHSVATQMLRGGASLKEIADVLRHRNLDTTTIYARVDLSVLKSVALPWPEVSQ
jgi:site-specific recombinase XerD